MTTQQRIDVMLASDAGKPIQCRRLRPASRYSISNSGIWEDTSDPGWNFFAFEYRVKPEPVVTVKYRVAYVDGGVRDYDNIDDAINRWTNSLFNPTLQKIETITNE